MRFERIAVVNGKTKNGTPITFSFKVVADNGSVSEYVNGYSNWDGKRSIDGFRVEWNSTVNSERLDTWDTTRKEAIKEAVYREFGRYSMAYHTLSYTLEKV